MTSRAITINEQLLQEERKFLIVASASEDEQELQQMNDMLNHLARKEGLYLSAVASLLKIIASGKDKRRII